MKPSSAVENADNMRQNPEEKQGPVMNIYIYNCFEYGGLIQFSKSVIDSWKAMEYQSINRLNEQYSQYHMLLTCRTPRCLLEAVPSCIFYNFI